MASLSQAPGGEDIASRADSRYDSENLRYYPSVSAGIRARVRRISQDPNTAGACQDENSASRRAPDVPH